MKVMTKGGTLFLMTFFMSVHVTVSSCAGSLPAGPLQITLDAREAAPAAAGRGDTHAVVVSGLSGQELQSLRSAGWSDDAWHALFRVSVAGSEPAPIVGRYTVTPQAVRFEPRFPFDAGRSYAVRFDPTRLPAPRAGTVVEQTVALPARALSPTTVVTAIHPAAGAWPENMLRFYIHFSAPMSATTSFDYVHLIDESGEEVTETFLALDTDLWNSDYTRCTVFFDPGRVKKGVGPNLKLGRAIRAGRRYALVVDSAWPDANRQPLKAGYRHEFRGGAAIERAIAIGDWRISAPAAGSRDPVTVTFPWALDRALLARAVGITVPAGRAVEGDTAPGAGETIWTFRPRLPWQPGDYRVTVLTLLEDPSGNRVGRAFEIEAFEQPQRTPEAERVHLPFQIARKGP
jgi:hypothetical protein